MLLPVSDQNVAEVIPGAHKAGGHEQGSHDQRWQRELEAYGRQRGRSLRNLPSLIGFAPGIGMRFKALKRWIHRLKQQLSIVYTATADPDMPKYLRWLGVAIVAYSLSPIDLIPDFIPVVGLLDDFIIVPAGIALLIKLTPLEVCIVPERWLVIEDISQTHALRVCLFFWCGVC